MKFMTQEEKDNRDERPCLYRCEGEVNEWGPARITFKKHFIVKETKCGYWIDVHGYLKKWVSKDGLKRYAHLTKKEALFAFKKRKEKQIQILESQLHGAKQMLTEANKIDLDNIDISLLEKELADMREEHKLYWQDYGSELCPGSMLAKEEKLEERIRQLKENVR